MSNKDDEFIEEVIIIEPSPGHYEAIIHLHPKDYKDIDGGVCSCHCKCNCVCYCRCDCVCACHCACSEKV